MLEGEHDFSAFARVIDVGGGRGGFLAAILRAHPDVRGALYDLPHVVKEATVLDAPDLRGRTSRLGGDFLQSVPALFDAYVLKRVLHDWEDSLPNFVKVMPRDYKRAMAELAAEGEEVAT